MDAYADSVTRLKSTSLTGDLFQQPGPLVPAGDVHAVQPDSSTTLCGEGTRRRRRLEEDWETVLQPELHHQVPWLHDALELR